MRLTASTSTLALCAGRPPAPDALYAVVTGADPSGSLPYPAGRPRRRTARSRRRVELVELGLYGGRDQLEPVRDGPLEVGAVVEPSAVEPAEHPDG